MTDLGWWAEQFPALGGLRDALSRGTKRSRLRLTAAVCPSSHTLVEVYRGSDGELYALSWEDLPSSIYPSGSNGALQYLDGTPRRRAVPYRLAHAAEIVSWCRCRSAGPVGSATCWLIPAQCLIDAAASRRRVVAPPEWQVAQHAQDE